MRCYLSRRFLISVAFRLSDAPTSGPTGTISVSFAAAAGAAAAAVAIIAAVAIDLRLFSIGGYGA